MEKKLQRGDLFKRVLSLALALVMVLGFVPVPHAHAADVDTTVYLKPNANWLVDNARFAIYYFVDASDNGWTSMSDEDGDGYYKGVVPAGYSNIIFCRMSPNSTENNWGNKWNQTGDLTLPTDGTNCYTIADDSWESGTWSTYPPSTEEPEIPSEPETEGTAKYIIAGVAELCGTAWDVANTDNAMTLNADGLYEKTYANVAAGSYQFKVTDGSWDNCWGGDGPDGNYVLTVETTSDATILFDADTKEITVELEEVTPDYIIAGQAALCGTDWDVANTDNGMFPNSDGLYEKTYTNVAAGSYQFKVTDGSWDNCWGGDGPDGNYVLTVKATSNVTILFDAESKAITVNQEVVETEEPETPSEPEETETTYPVQIKIHYTREDGNYEGWDVYQWGGVEATAFEVGENEAVATIYANSNSGNIGFIVRYGGDSWTDREWVTSDSGDRTVTGLSDIVTGTVHVYVDHANPAETVIELGDDVICTGDEHIDIRVHYTREDGNYEGWDVFAWNNQSVTPFEVSEDGTEAVATIRAYSNSQDIGFIVRYGGDSWTDREWVDANTGDRTVSGLSGIYCGTIDVYVDHANPSETVIVLGTVAYGTGEAPEYDIEIQVHYYRADGNYTDWEVHMWNGVDSLSSTRAFEDDEVTYDGVTYAKTATYYADASDTWVGFIIKKPDWTKDPDGDRKIDISDVTGGTVHVYAVSGSALEDFATDKSGATLGAKVTAAVYDQTKEKLTVTVSYPLENVGSDTFTLEGPDGEMTITGVTAVDEYNYVVAFEGEITEDAVYTVYFNGIPCVVTVPNLYSTEAWEAEFTYEGDDLGATWTAESTTFRVWAPTATAVSVNLYTSGTEGTDDLIKSVEMTADVNGTWVVTVDGDLNGTYYTYSVTRSGETVEACDPYARTTGVNGNRAMVIDLDSTDPEGWENDPYVTQDNYTDAVIWELHVRDFSIDASSGMTNKGKYLAFTETGTTVNGEGEIATGVDYMKELGVNYVHLLPVYDINSVDETVGGYNWGYDPKNYNVPEGSYSTDPYNGEVRVNEFKQMVQSLHEAGIGVVMDVVYNHVADAKSFCFNQIVPGYFSRIQDDGTYQSNSGCGNDTASERSMVSKYIVDSVLYWNTEYHIDGFRWDLVGLIDYETINAVMEAVHAVNPDIIFYGEGWEMCSWTTKEGYVEKMTTQANDAKVNTEAGTFAFFNDTIRNAIHGGVFTVTDKGFASGGAVSDALIYSYMANCTWGSSGDIDTPLQTVNYASCHDNYTLFDNLMLDTIDMTGKTASELTGTVAAKNRLAAAYYITAQGIPFIHAGEEMLRSKPDADSDTGYNHNSYASGDEINSIKWSTLADETVDTTHDYYQGLIAFRKAHASLRLTSEAAVSEAVKTIYNSGNTMAFHISTEAEELVTAFNSGNTATTITLPKGEWDVYVQGDKAGTTVLGTVEGTVTVDAISSVVLVKKVEAEEHVHKYGEPVFVWAEDYTCTAYVACACGDQQTVNVTVTSVTTDATCTEDGKIVYTAVSGEYSDAVEVGIPASGHSYEAVVTAPTCTEQGYTTYTCATCGDSYVDDCVDALGHNYEDGACTVCGEDDPNSVPAETVKPSWKSWLDKLFGKWFGDEEETPTEPSEPEETEPSEPEESVPAEPVKPSKPSWGGIIDWFRGLWG